MFTLAHYTCERLIYTYRHARRLRLLQTAAPAGEHTWLFSWLHLVIFLPRSMQQQRLRSAQHHVYTLQSVIWRQNNISLILSVITVYWAEHLSPSLSSSLSLPVPSLTEISHLLLICLSLSSRVPPFINLSAHLPLSPWISLKLLPPSSHITSFSPVSYALHALLHLKPPPPPTSCLPDCRLSPVSPVDDNICLPVDKSVICHGSKCKKALRYR